MYLHANAKLGLAGRLALVRAIEDGLSLRAAAAAFGVSPATAHRWWHRWRDASEGLPAWSRHVGDPILESNITRRVDFALFMVAAIENDELINEAPAIVGCQTPSALAHRTLAFA